MQKSALFANEILNMWMQSRAEQKDCEKATCLPKSREMKVKDKNRQLHLRRDETSREQRKKMMMKCGIPSCGCSNLPIPFRIPFRI
jgi:hypothetical protein